jgi:hypothetical protein
MQIAVLSRRSPLFAQSPLWTLSILVAMSGAVFFLDGFLLFF